MRRSALVIILAFVTTAAVLAGGSPVAAQEQGLAQPWELEVVAGAAAYAKVVNMPADDGPWLRISNDQPYSQWLLDVQATDPDAKVENCIGRCNSRSMWLPPHSSVLFKITYPNPQVSGSRIELEFGPSIESRAMDLSLALVETVFNFAGSGCVGSDTAGLVTAVGFKIVPELLPLVGRFSQDDPELFSVVRNLLPRVASVVLMELIDSSLSTALECTARLAVLAATLATPVGAIFWVLHMKPVIEVLTVYSALALSDVSPYTTFELTFAPGIEEDISGQSETVAVDPVVSVSPSSGDQNTTFSGSGSGFTPNSTARLQFWYPSGALAWDDSSKAINSSGAFSFTWFWESGQQFGQYRVRATDNTTGVRSSYEYFTIY